MRLLLAEPLSRREFEAELREKLPNLAERLDDLAPDRDMDEQLGQVLATRSLAKEFVAEHPGAPADVELDCAHVEVISTPYVHELLAAWPAATAVNANVDVSETFEFVRERLAER